MINIILQLHWQKLICEQIEYLFCFVLFSTCCTLTVLIVMLEMLRLLLLSLFVTGNRLVFHHEVDRDIFAIDAVDLRECQSRR